MKTTFVKSAFGRVRGILGCAVSVAVLTGLPAFAEPFKIGVSNTFVDAWHVQMLEAMARSSVIA